MTFHSILFDKAGPDTMTEAGEAPAFFSDLNLDQVINAITARRDEYDLKPFFFLSLNEIDAVKYRQEIALDLETDSLLRSIKSFAKSMHEMRHHLAYVDKLYYKYHKEGWFLEAVQVYCDAVTCLIRDLGRTNPKSRGFLAFREYLTNYARSPEFATLLSETKRLKSQLSVITYCVLVKDNWVKVSKCESEVDYSREVEETFAKFRQGEVKDYTCKLPTASGMNHVDAAILDFIAKLNPEVFLDLDKHSLRNRDYVDETIARFDREAQFYIAYLEYVAKLKRAGLPFCYPEISACDKEVYHYGGFDLALAHKLVTAGSSVVCNDFHLNDQERIIVVSGPNQGGKTTFARTFGQLHYLAALGCPVPGRKAKLLLADRIFTHFEKEENIANLRGKLRDDLVRVHDILAEATSSSVIIVNEIFTSTTLKDAVFLGKEIIKTISRLDSLSVYVTFIDELSLLSEKTVSMVSTIVPGNPALRTYKIVRMPADGLSYALSIAEKYGLTYHSLKERLKS